ncbi:hypothetical protein NJ7G_3840 [Natrinema sp. J7-2]|uniref:Uncharacterized protein n=1 Tax=Natrinema gari JCM 14663 TaxID=1230459 RepID=L9YXE2_9EURY|nr:hypothetical protein NJ7G_3840 [Natrinema sp. J7-2]ELY77563.1 hypothetical protein C486_15704 [Natrinema gari JCM 14663]
MGGEQAINPIDKRFLGMHRWSGPGVFQDQAPIRVTETNWFPDSDRSCKKHSC